MKTKVLIGVLALLVLGAAAYLLYMPTPPGAGNPAPATPGPISVNGEIVCLPHRNTGGPQTEECAIGLRGDDGNHYGLLDLKQDDIVSGKFGTGVKVSVSGTLAPAPESKYAIAGNISVKTIAVR